MARYEGEEIEVIPPVLKPNERELILVTHDKYIFYANDGKKEFGLMMVKCHYEKREMEDRLW